MEVLFAKRLRQLRKAQYMTQTTLAKKLNYGYTAIANYEAGKNEPNYRDLIKMAQILNVSVDYLIGASNELCSFEGGNCWKDFVQFAPDDIREAVSLLITKITILYQKESNSK